VRNSSNRVIHVADLKFVQHEVGFTFIFLLPGFL